MRRVGGFSLGAAVLLSSVWVGSTASAAPISMRAAMAPMAGPLFAAPIDALASVPPLPITGEASVAPLVAEDLDGVQLTDPPALRPAPSPVIVDPVVDGFDEELSTEDIDSRSRFETVFDNVDGTETTEFSMNAVNYQDGDGEWVKIDPTLVPVRGVDGTFEVKDNSWSATFGPEGVSIVGEKGSAFSIRGGEGSKMSVPVIGEDGRSATYVEAWPGVDLRFVVDNVSVRKELVIAGPDVGNSFELVYDGLSVATDEAGRLSV